MTSNSLTRRVALTILCVALVPRLAIVLQPIPVQLGKMLPDDAYYYFLTARNILEKQSPSIDGIHESNGWHPLWLCVNLGVFALPFENPDTPVRLALAIEALFDSLVAVVLYLMVRRFVSNIAAVIGALFYALNSMPIFQSVNGLETGISALLVALSCALSLLLVEKPQKRTTILWGAVFGLCFLGRTDTALILVWLGLYVLFRLPGDVRWRLTLFGAVTAVIVISPWLAWNHIMFGSALSQVSGAAVPWAIEARYEALHPDDSLWKLSLATISEPSPWLRGDYLGSPPLIGLILWPLGLIAVRRARGPLTRPLVTIALLLLAGNISLLLVHTLIRWYPRPWYFAVAAQSLAITMAFLWDAIQIPALRSILLTITLVLMLIIGLIAWEIGYHPWQAVHQYVAAQWIKANTPQDVLIASMNAGILGYYSERTVVNLDGVVNPEAFDAIKEYRLLAYMQQIGVDYFADPDHAVQNEYGLFMGPDYEQALQEIVVTGEPYEGLGSYRVYRVMIAE